MKKIVKKALNYQFIRYSIGWGLAALLDLFMLWFFTDIVWIYYILSAILAFIISCTFWYLFQKYITFRNHSKNHLRQWWLFVLFQIIWLGIYLFILWIWVDVLHLYYLLVAIIWKWIAFIWNYFSNHYLNFNRK